MPPNRSASSYLRENRTTETQFLSTNKSNLSAKPSVDQPNHQTRPYCYRCHKPASMCLCAHLSLIQNEVGVHVLQHPRERRHPVGTARLLRLGLSKVAIHPLDLTGRSAVSAPVDLPDGAGLLYPSPDAQDLDTLTQDKKPSHLVVIDGTWTQAHRIFRDNPWISALPRYTLPTSEPSRYRIRKEPRLECLSTVESVVAALLSLQPGLQGTQTLLSAFEAMIDAQIAASEQPRTQAPRTRIRRKAPKPIPDVLLAPGAQIILAYTEAGAHRPGDSKTQTPQRLSAVTLNGAHVFDRMIKTTTVPDAFLAKQMEVELNAVETGLPYHQVMTAFHEFCTGPSADSPAGDSTPGTRSTGAPVVLVSWNVRTMRLLENSQANPRCVLLKGVWANLSRKRVPALETLVSNLGLAPADLPVAGRSGRRLAQARAMLQHILDSATRAS